MKTDLKKVLPDYTARHGVVDLVRVPPRQFLVVDGEGDPDTSDSYAAALAALYPVAYALKAVSRATSGLDHVVMPLEALWWADDPAAFTSARDKRAWRWTVMNLVPDHLGAEHVESAREMAAGRRGAAPLDRLRLEQLEEGLCVQTLHLGAYDDEGPTIAAMHHEAVAVRAMRLTGRHHEIYLGDPRRTPPERLRTILRQPVTPDRAPGPVPN